MDFVRDEYRRKDILYDYRTNKLYQSQFWPKDSKSVPEMKLKAV